MEQSLELDLHRVAARRMVITVVSARNLPACESYCESTRFGVAFKTGNTKSSGNPLINQQVSPTLSIARALPPPLEQCASGDRADG